MISYVEALRIISRTPPDAKLPVLANDMVPELKERGLLETFGCSDGDYVELTDVGKRMVELLSRPPQRRVETSDA